MKTATAHQLYRNNEPFRISDMEEKEYVEQMKKGISNNYSVQKFDSVSNKWILFPDHEDNGYREIGKAIRLKKK